VLYDAITRLRNHLFDSGLKPSFEFETRVISVGNLAVGGTGKTPMTEYLIRILCKDFKISTLSRGYGRRTKGLRFGSSDDTATTLGDEPYQLYRKFNHQVTVAVGEDRAFAIPNILQQFPETEIILMDDAFQHRFVKPQLSILVSEFNNPFYADFVMPLGRLREARKGAARADLIVFTKCPKEATKEEFDLRIKGSKKYAGNKPIFFASIRYSLPINFGNLLAKVSTQVILVTGIANANVFKEYVAKNYKVVKHFEFIDHHRYSINDLNTIHEYLKKYPEASILTTEKDMVKLIDKSFAEILTTAPWFYIPIELFFVEGGDRFENSVRHTIGG
jgi:tetraacyldisaccharide 4'-kinase